jgi:hypothetical protein
MARLFSVFEPEYRRNSVQTLRIVGGEMKIVPMNYVLEQRLRNFCLSRR